MDKLNASEDTLIVGKGVLIEGKIKSDGYVEVEGTIVGDVFASDIKIGESGRVEGVIKSTKLDIGGFAGDEISVSDSLHVRSSGRVHGDVSYGSIQIDAGATIFGNVKKNTGTGDDAMQKRNVIQQDPTISDEPPEETY